MRGIRSNAECDPDKTRIPDSRRDAGLKRDIRLDHAILKVGSRQQYKALVILSFDGDLHGPASQIFHSFHLDLRGNQAGRIPKWKGLHTRRRLAIQATSR